MLYADTMTARTSGEARAAFPPDPIKVGISACLLGEAVRYDGGHKYEAFVAALADRFSLVPTCPEVEIGLGVPREPVHLVYREGEVRLVADSGVDHTAKMRAFAAGRARDLEHAGLCGYVFKRSSPSCGLRGVALAGTDRDASGLFADTLVTAIPDLPVEEETVLRDPAKLHLFVARVLEYHRKVRSSP